MVSLTYIKEHLFHRTWKTTHRIRPEATRRSQTIHSIFQSPVVQLKPICPCDGGCPSCEGVIQPKLIVDQPRNMYEQEADRVAEQVLRIPESQVLQQPNEEQILQTKNIPAQTSEVNLNLVACINAVKSSGQPLATSTRAFFEPRFRYNFINVRVHTDAEASTLTDKLNALAFTAGQDIFFRRGEYQPDSSYGREVLAHELTHVVQQQGRFFQIQRRVASNYNVIKDNLSYGIFDWAITDKEAREVLQILNSLSQEDLLGTVQQMRRDKIFNSLLTNISDSDRISFSDLLGRIQKIEKEITGLPDCCKEVLRRIDVHISSAKMLSPVLAASPFIRTFGHHPAVQGLHLLETKWDIYAMAVKSVPTILKESVKKEIELHLLDHQKTPERIFWEKMRVLWR